eukprot:TRINITY_DN14190_c0_g2_i1.p1 TRINITY_DN14190_c0_g2~~TRINITY_DN14190_c0_g2_i1.p1  ORF type:complete len:369 (-),score=59.61 TRINITY_DN14190_c0_g2_i1:115-1221(-)
MVNLPCFSVVAALVGWLPAQGVRIGTDAMSEVDLEESLDSTSEGPFRCTANEKQQFWERFRVGKVYGKPCSEEERWGNTVIYDNPASDVISLYIFPKEDHNGAFGLCGGNKFDPTVCKRMLGQSDYFSVYFRRVNSVEEATQIFSELAPSTKIKHLVLGGHGDATGLGWGTGEDGTAELAVGNAATVAFFDAAYPHMLLGEDGGATSTVFMDACLNGKTLHDLGEKNMVNYVAHRLAGVTIFGSKISWDNDMFHLRHAKDFGADIVSGRTGNDVMVKVKFGQGPLRDWGYSQNSVCVQKKYQKKTNDIAVCRKKCEASRACQAFVWFPTGNGVNSTKQCYLSTDCSQLKESTQQARVFFKPEATAASQ